MTSETNDTTNAAPAVTPINEYVTMQPASFHFKTDKPTEVKDEAGNVVDTKPGVKPPSVTIHLPIPKVSRLMEFLSDETEKFAKERELLMSIIAGAVFTVTRGQINDFREKNPTGTVTPSIINYDLLDFTAIANMPKSERGSYVPSDEDNKAFLASYLEIMPGATGKDVKRIQSHIDIIAVGFKKHRAQKEVLEFFQESFAVYLVAAGDAAEEHEEVIEYYQNKLARMLKAEDKTISMDDL